ncbi:YqaJ viral recombinase family protein [Engelhardtia mirabilis]|uniref:YqaJ-like viral recombinase domain protein n=1 Tax=Engelhardtia mirabilis TaxID=2528011 RepID=A0A518BL21_9BACT|nr:YqaJ-like viral recombinase domain protein [Planctomycetes bacterium Pla133]QDV01992.1 YqaJ-like viral recombinase domain protein [Planctomycetes bacterium Pla86]
MILPTRIPSPTPEEQAALEEWRTVRRTGIGSSDAASACGLDKYRSSLQLWGEKAGLLAEPDLDDVEVVYMGRVLEPVIREEINRRTDFEVVPYDSEDLAGAFPDCELAGIWNGQPLYRHKTERWRLVSPDGFVRATREIEFTDDTGTVVLVPGELLLLECKSVGFYAGADWDAEPPIRPLMQVTHGMATLGLKATIVAAMVERNFRPYYQPLNDRLALNMLQRERALWGCVESMTEPPFTQEVDPRAWIEAHDRLHPDDTGEEVEVDAVVDDLLETRDELKERIKKTEEHAKAIEARLAEALKDATFGRTPSGRKFSRKTIAVSGGTIERKPYTYRRLHVGKPTAPAAV